MAATLPDFDRAHGPFAGRNVLVTGGGRGIGRAIALGFAAQGAAVAVVARTRSEVDAVAAEARRVGGRALAVEADVTRPEDVDRAAKSTVEAFGSVDILVNNAGINLLGRVSEQPLDEWWSVIHTCVGGTLHACRAVVPQMIARGYGRIVNVASRAAKVGQPFSTSYCAAKHAVLGFTRALALELADRGVTVNAVCPGLVSISDRYWRRLAELTGAPAAALRQKAIDACPQKRELVPDEVVPAVLFLASDEARHTTGEALNVSGGLLMH